MVPPEIKYLNNLANSLIQSIHMAIIPKHRVNQLTFTFILNSNTCDNYFPSAPQDYFCGLQ